jgi:hypothetical protein
MILRQTNVPGKMPVDGKSTLLSIEAVLDVYTPGIRAVVLYFVRGPALIN